MSFRSDKIGKKKGKIERKERKERDIISENYNLILFVGFFINNAGIALKWR